MTNPFKTSPLQHLRSVICASAALGTVLFTAASAQTPPAQPQARITSAVDNAVRATIPGSHIALVSALNDAGAVPASLPFQGVTLVFSRSEAQKADLQALLLAQQDPASSLFHQWLTPAQFGARFGAAASDIAAVQSWLASQGFALGTVSTSRDRISFSGSAAQVQSAFGTNIHYFRSLTDTDTHFAPTSDISLPAAIAASVLTVNNLSSFRPRSHIVRPSPNFTDYTKGAHYTTPGDIATIYDLKSTYAAGYNGAGQTIAIIGQSYIVPADITTFQTAVGVASHLPNLTIVPNSGTSTLRTGDETESDLDLEYSSSIAPGANIAFIYTGSNNSYGVFDSLQYAVDNKVGNIISSSYGICETLLTAQGFGEIENILAQAATQGQSVLSAAGDAGATDCYPSTGTTSTLTLAQQQTPTADYPASSNFVTAIGGTEFLPTDVAAGNTTYWTAQAASDTVSSALSYIPEQTWNDDYPAGNGYIAGLSSGGGGVSVFSIRPPWQTGVPGISSSTYRTVPDVSLHSSPAYAPYAFCSSDTAAWNTGQKSSCTSGLRDATSGLLTSAGGTSFATPIFAGMLALINQAKSPSGQGLINPTLYTLASTSTTYASAFHDITLGGNYCSTSPAICSSAGLSAYSAAAGYDLATGLGSVDLNNLLTAWPKTVATSTSFALAAPAVTIKSGSTGTVTVTVTPSNGYTGTVYFSVSSLSSASLNYVCYAVANASVSGTGAVTSTINISTSVGTCASGASPFVKSGTPTAIAFNKDGSGFNQAASGFNQAASAFNQGGSAFNQNASGSAAQVLASNRTPAFHHTPTPSPWKQAPVPASLAGLLVIACVSRRSRRLRGLGLSLVAFAALGAAAGLSGCSNNAAPAAVTTTTTPVTTTSTTPAGTYAITIAGYDKTNSAITASTSFNLTIN